MCVCLTLVLTMISPRVKKRFPTLEHLVDTGLLLENELVIFESLNYKFPKPSKHWLPIVWASSIVTRARKEGRIRDDFAVKTLIDELNKFRGLCGNLMHYDTISVPLVYTQVGHITEICLICPSDSRLFRGIFIWLSTLFHIVSGSRFDRLKSIETLADEPGVF